MGELRSARSNLSEMPDRLASRQAVNRQHVANVGHASGEGLNCLFDTIVQLRDNVKRLSNEETSQTREIGHEARRIREALVATGTVPSEGEIDIYGGAGAQLAHDLNLRIQVTQRTEDGSLIHHPVLGEAGRLVHILHTPGHFQPLWQNTTQED